MCTRLRSNQWTSHSLPIHFSCSGASPYLQRRSSFTGSYRQNLLTQFMPLDRQLSHRLSSSQWCFLSAGMASQEDYSRQEEFSLSASSCQCSKHHYLSPADRCPSPNVLADSDSSGLASESAVKQVQALGSARLQLVSNTNTARQHWPHFPIYLPQV